MAPDSQGCQRAGKWREPRDQIFISELLQLSGTGSHGDAPPSRHLTFLRSVGEGGERRRRRRGEKKKGGFAEGGLFQLCLRGLKKGSSLCQEEHRSLRSPRGKRWHAAALFNGKKQALMREINNGLIKARWEGGVQREGEGERTCCVGGVLEQTE